MQKIQGQHYSAIFAFEGPLDVNTIIRDIIIIILELIEILKQRVLLLLQNKEETTQGVSADHWLSMEAASLEAIGKDGTFRYTHLNNLFLMIVVSVPYYM